MKKVGCQKTFNVDGVIEMVKAQLDHEISMNYGFVSVGGVDIFAIEVAESDKKILLEGKYFVYENNDVEEKVVNQNDEPITLFISYTECDAPIVDIIENKIKEIVGTKVKVNHKANGKGKIEIEYYSNAELERIYDLFLSTRQ